jgi:hypothetical protein
VGAAGPQSSILLDWHCQQTPPCLVPHASMERVQGEKFLVGSALLHQCLIQQLFDPWKGSIQSPARICSQVCVFRVP